MSVSLYAHVPEDIQSHSKMESGLTKMDSYFWLEKCHQFLVKGNRPFSKMAAENSNKSKLKTYTSTRKNTFTLVKLQCFSFSGVTSAEKM